MQSQCGFSQREVSKCSIFLKEFQCRVIPREVSRCLIFLKEAQYVVLPRKVSRCFSSLKEAFFYSFFMPSAVNKCQFILSFVLNTLEMQEMSSRALINNGWSSEIELNHKLVNSLTSGECKYSIMPS